MVRRGRGLGLKTSARVARRVEGCAANAGASALLERHRPCPGGGGARVAAQLGEREAAHVQLVPVRCRAERRTPAAQPNAHDGGIGRCGEVAAW